ncbi:MAG: Rv2175c family DNA-binding protein [Ornithinimicrobium sp.]
MIIVISDNNVIHEGDWLAVPDIMERTGRSLPTVRTWLQERDLIGMRRGPNNALMVPSAFVTDEGPLKALRGTLSVLGDSGLSDEEILTWLGERDETLLGGSPIGALEGGHKTEIRRRAQELAF